MNFRCQTLVAVVFARSQRVGASLKQVSLPLHHPPRLLQLGAEAGYFGFQGFVTVYGFDDEGGVVICFRRIPNNLCNHFSRAISARVRSEEHTSELQSPLNL